MTTTRSGTSREGAPLLGSSTGGDGEATKQTKEKTRFATLNAFVFAVAALGFLMLCVGDPLGGIPGAKPSKLSKYSGVSQQHTLYSPALTSEFVDTLNARLDKSWTARVPKGMEGATHSDLKRLSGGRLSNKVKDVKDGWQVSAFATKVSPDRSEAENTFTKEMHAAAHSRVTATRGDKAAFEHVQRSKRVSARLGKVKQKFGLSFGRLGGFIEDFLGGGGSGSSSPAGSFDPVSHGLPESFDTREKWPGCGDLIGRGRDQGNCGSCWAMAPAEVMSDRLCVQTNGAISDELSPYQLMACTNGFGAAGCDGGESSVAYEYAMRTGIVTGAAYGDTNTCAPYPFEACHHPCSVFPTPKCPSTCTHGDGTHSTDEVRSGEEIAALGEEEVEDVKERVTHIASFGKSSNRKSLTPSVGDMNTKVKVAAITSCPTFDYACIAEELYRYGPVSSYAGDIYEEFYAYADGVFRESEDPNMRGDNHGGHVIKIIGWGREQETGEYYWIIVNSWLNWGQNGVGKIAVGQVGIGAGVESAVMEIPEGIEVLPVVPGDE